MLENSEKRKKKSPPQSPKAQDDVISIKPKDCHFENSGKSSHQRS